MSASISAPWGLAVAVLAAAATLPARQPAVAAQASTSVGVTARGAVEGEVVDDLGEPVVSAQVRLFRRRYQRGEYRFVAQSAGGGQSDDRGRFRLFDVPAGKYYLRAKPPQSMAAGVFYPGTTVLSEARQIEVVSGEDVRGVRFVLPEAARAKVTVVVRTSDGVVARNASLVVGAEDGGGGFEAQRGSDGSFSFRLEPGEFHLTVQVGGPVGGPTGELAYEPFQVTGPDVSLTVTTTRRSTARGRVVFDAAADASDARGTWIEFETARDLHGSPAGSPVRGQVNDDATFEVAGVAGSRMIRASYFGAHDWALRRVLHHGRDVTDDAFEFAGADLDGIEIHMTQRVSHVTGSVADAAGQLVDEVVVLIFADDPDAWTYPSRFVRIVRPSDRGQFDVRNLPPARYLALAVPYSEAAEDGDPEVLMRLRASRQGRRFVLGEGESRTLAVPVTTIQ